MAIGTRHPAALGERILSRHNAKLTSVNKVSTTKLEASANAVSGPAMAQARMARVTAVVAMSGVFVRA